MVFRLAVAEDLRRLNDVYRGIVSHMDDHGIGIWDDVYPFCHFQEDIQNGRLYGLFDGGEPVAAFALCDVNAGERAVRWCDPAAKALYLDRFGVGVRHLRKGWGGEMLARAKETAKALGAESLRLFVATINQPAIRLYEKNGFVRADGVFCETIAEDCVLREYGYEAKL